MCSSELKRLLIPQPPPLNTRAAAGESFLTWPRSIVIAMRSVQCAQESSILRVSAEWVLLTNSKKSIAQATSNLSVRFTSTWWEKKSISRVGRRANLAAAL